MSPIAPRTSNDDGQFSLFPLVAEFEVAPQDLMAAVEKLKLLEGRGLGIDDEGKQRLKDYLSDPTNRKHSMPTDSTARIYAFAKEIRRDSQEVVELAGRLGIKDRGSALASLTGVEQAMIRALCELSKSKASRPVTANTVPRSSSRGPQPPGPPIISPDGHHSSHAQTIPPRAPTAKKKAPSPPSKGLIPPLLELPLMRKDPFLLTLIDDVTEAERRLGENDTPFHRRTYVRTYFSTAEAVIVTLRDWLSERVDRVAMSKRDRNFTKSLLASNQVNFAHSDTTQFILGTYAFMRNCTIDLFTGEGWEAFQSSRHIRNALTHPKKQRGVEVSDDELNTVKSAQKWLFDAIGTLEQDQDSNEQSS